MKYILLLLSFLFAGCASAPFKSAVDHSPVQIGMSEQQVQTILEGHGKKLVFSENNADSFILIAMLGAERVWLSGNPMFGGTTTMRHHFFTVQFDGSKVSDTKRSSVDGNGKNVLPPQNYKNMYWLGEAMTSCKSYMSNEERGRYGFVVSEIINSWIYAKDVFESLQEYNRGNGSMLSPRGAEQCNDAIAYIERASYKIAERQRSQNRPSINIQNTNQVENTITIW